MGLVRRGDSPASGSRIAELEEELLRGEISSSTRDFLMRMGFSRIMIGEISKNREYLEEEIAVWIKETDNTVVASDSFALFDRDRNREATKQKKLSQIANKLCHVFKGNDHAMFMIDRGHAINQPELFGSKVVEIIDASQEVIPASPQPDDGENYLEVVTRSGHTAYVSRTLVAPLKESMREPLEDGAVSRIQPDELIGSWVRESVSESKFGLPKRSVEVLSFTIEALDDGGKYNGQRLDYKQLGGKLVAGQATPITWNMSEDWSTIEITLWTDVSDKGHRMLWNTLWTIQSWNSSTGELVVGKLLEGISRWSETLRRCDARDLGDLKEFCVNITITRFEK